MERGRERLLAGDPAAAIAAFDYARRWPGSARGAESGLALARARRGQLPDAGPELADLAPFAPSALLDDALEHGDLRGARALAELLVRAGQPLGPLYAGAVALERGDAAEAGRLAAASPVPLASRRIGRQLEQALVLRAFGASAVVRDRRGTLVGGLDGQGRLALAEGIDPLLLPPFQSEPPPRRRLPTSVEPASPYWLSPADARGAARAGGLRLTLDLDLARLALDALGR